MKIFCTGLPGTGKREYLEQLEKEVKETRGPNYLKVYKMGDIMFDIFRKRFKMKIQKANILNVREDLRKAAISLAYEEVMGDFRNYEHQILNSHEWFYWKKQFSTANSGYDLTKVNPDMFVTLINQDELIHRALLFKKEWGDRELSLDEILLWQNIEVDGTAKAAEFFEKEHYVISSNEPRSVLLDLIQNPRKELVYASFPMTNIGNPEGLKLIDDFVRNLRKYFIVLDPRSTEVGAMSTKTTKEQTVRRDMIWYISRVEKVVCFYPDLVYTAGAVNETNESFETSKDTLVVGLKSKGPFEEHFATKRFDSCERFFDFLTNEYFKDKGIAWINR